MDAENTRSKARKQPAQSGPEQERKADLESHQRETLNALVGEQVLHALGQPGNLVKVQVRPLWMGNYRVNVFAGASFADATIVNSYFVVADGDGNILLATPKITRRY